MSAAAIVTSIVGAWREQESAGNPLDASVGGRTDEAVRIQGHVSTDRAEPGTLIDCRFVVQNTGDQRIENLRLRELDAHGFERFTSSDFDPQRPVVLDARQITSFRPRRPLTASVVEQRANITAVFEWTVGKVVHQQPISLGPIAIRSVTEPRWYSVSKLYVGYLKDFFLPVVLLLITALVTRRQRESETAASWNLMLPKIHDYTGHFYFPISAAAGQFVTAFAEADATRPATFDKLTFALLLFRKRWRVQFERIGGFYLTTRAGEELIANCEDAFLDELKPCVSLELLNEAKDAIGRYTELYVFKRNGLNTAPVQAVQNGLIAWKSANAAKAKAAVNLLDVLATVLDYDLNLTYRFWYGSPDLPLEKRDEIAALRASDCAALRKIADDYEKYRDEMKKRRW
jgi:hypothetical protein